MCKICRNEYEGLNHLYCENCPSLITIPNIKGLRILTIFNCPNVTTIPNIKGLEQLNCYCCPLLMYTSITNIKNYDNNLLKRPYKDCKYLTSDKMNKLYNNIYNLWNQYRIKKYSQIKNKLNEDTMNMIIEYIIKQD